VIVYLKVRGRGCPVVPAPFSDCGYMKNPSFPPWGRVRQRYVVGRVEGEPVALPSAEQLRAHRLHQRMVDLQPLARLLAATFGNVGRVHRHPAMVRQEDLGATVLGLADVGAARAERLVAEHRRGHADAVDIASRDADGSPRPTNSALMSPHLPPKLRVSSMVLMSPTPHSPHLRLAVGIGFNRRKTQTVIEVASPCSAERATHTE